MPGFHEQSHGSFALFGNGRHNEGKRTISYTLVLWLLKR
jgi:hypothetical protein